MASIKAYLRKRGIAGDTYPIVVRVIQNRKMNERQVKDYRIDEDSWDYKNGCLKKNHPRATKINYEIKRMIRKFEDSYDQLIFENNGKITTEKIIASSEKDDESKSAVKMSTYLEDYINKNPDNLGYNTIRYYKTTLYRWMEVYPSMKLADVGNREIQDFRKYLRTQGNGVNTIYNRLKTIRKICNRARRDGLISKNPFIDIRLSQVEGNRQFLTWEEISKLLSLQLEGYNDLVRDLFCFSCFTGLRFGDMCTLKTNHILRDGDKYRLKMKISKTKQTLSFSLNQNAIKILAKYSSSENDEYYLFPIIRFQQDDNKEKQQISSKNAVVNRVLKQICQMADIQKEISMYCGRHTFATISLSLGGDIYVLSKILGHTSVETTQIYGKIIDQRKDELISKWDKIFEPNSN